MLRALVLFGVVALAGCQSQNPYALFGPHRVPTPGIGTPAPYYPANVSAAPGAATPTAGSTGRVSVSADAAPPLSATTSAAANSADKEQIRIVENPQPAVRTAASPRSPGTSGTIATPPSGSALPPSTSGKSSQSTRTDTSVTPAGYEQPAPATGQWKAR